MKCGGVVGEGKDTYRVSIANQCIQLCINTASTETKRANVKCTHFKFELKATPAKQTETTDTTRSYRVCPTILIKSQLKLVVNSIFF